MNVKDIEIKNIEIVENVRISVKDIGMQELMSSIKQHGLEQPIGVGETPSGKYVLIYGNRRLVACTKLGWKTIPAVVTDEPNIKDLLLLNMTENLQRQDVSPIEMGRICDRLKGMQMNEAEIAIRLSIPVSKVNIALRSYHSLPEKHRSKVKFMGKGAHKKGDLAATSVQKVLNMKKAFGLSDASLDKILSDTRMNELSSADLSLLNIFMKQGSTPNAALKMLKEYSVFRYDVVYSNDELSARMEKGGYTRKLDFFTSIMYGEEKPLKRPEFLKSNSYNKRGL